MPTLADLFNEKSQDIYKKFSAREEPSSQPYISILPDSNDSRSRIKNDNRALPVISTLRDTQRVSKFLRSSDGLLFLAKQTLLQTGNTFVNTKLYNPLSPLLNTVPFVHARRHISTQVVVPNAFGLLQNNTVEDITSKFKITGQLQALSTNKRGLLPTLGSIAKTYVATQLKKAANTIVPLPQNYSESRPEYKIFSDVTGPVVFSPQPLDQRGLPRISLEANIKNTLLTKTRSTLIKAGVAALNRTLPKSLRNKVPVPTPILEETNKIPTFVQAATQFRQNFTDKLPKKFTNDLNNSRVRSKYLSESDTGFADIGTNPSSTSFGIATSGLTKLQDPYNKRKLVSSTDANKINYNNIIKEQDRNSDIIKFIFRDVEGNNPVHFRALLSTIKESIKTEFNEQRYVGRTERFVTYGGAKRGLSLSFNIVAFSQNEADGMWSRVNYLSGLAFPKDVVNGFMVPPLFKLTIGALYENQPCYIESLDYDFLDESITFDVTKEVPFAINVNMQLSILEKRSKFYDSPFYKITEDIVDLQYATPSDEQARVLDNTLLDVSAQIDANIAVDRLVRTNPNLFQQSQ
jgi:hypothetical protein